jgi:hypothetical protein
MFSLDFHTLCTGLVWRRPMRHSYTVLPMSQSNPRPPHTYGAALCSECRNQLGRSRTQILEQLWPGGRPLTLADVEDLLRLPEGAVLNLLRDGKLRGAKVGGKWQVMPEDLAYYVMATLSEPDASEPARMPEK